jgi:hypothetical protein
MGGSKPSAPLGMAAREVAEMRGHDLALSLLARRTKAACLYVGSTRQRVLPWAPVSRLILA